MTATADVVICGAGIAGIATAYFLTQQHGVRDIAIVDYRSPLSLTSDKSSEGYRNWWPGPGDAMIRFMNRSIDLLDRLAIESDNRFHLNRRGYVYLTSDPRRADHMHQAALNITQLGAGPLRMDGQYASSLTRHDPQLSGVDVVRDPAVIRSCYPFMTTDTAALFHTRRCGWLSAQQLSMYLFEQTRAAGTRLVNGEVTAVTVRGNRIEAVRVRAGMDVFDIRTRNFVIAAGPLIAEVSAFLGIELPVYNEPHGKIAFEDTEGIIDRNAPLMIWNDPVLLPWNEAEKAELAAFEETAPLLEEFPPGLHFRPEGGPGSQTILALWPYHITTMDKPHWPLEFGPDFVEIVMRGLTRMIPDLAVYLERMSKPTIDGGYYCKTRENRPLICPLPVSGAFVIGALSGYGIMAAPAAGELLAAHIVHTEVPSYAAAFDLNRYEDSRYRKLLDGWDPTAGQL